MLDLASVMRSGLTVDQSVAMLPPQVMKQLVDRARSITRHVIENRNYFYSVNPQSKILTRSIDYKPPVYIPQRFYSSDDRQ